MTAEQVHPRTDTWTEPALVSPRPASTAGNHAAVNTDVSVVILDDTQANVARLAKVLDGLGIDRVYGFTDPRAAIAHCADALPDLIMLDLHLRHLDGFAVMKSLRKLVPADVFLPIVVLTADISAEVKEQALFAGANDVTDGLTRERGDQGKFGKAIGIGRCPKVGEEFLIRHERRDRIAEQSGRVADVPYRHSVF